MTNFAIEMLEVREPNGDIALYFTARNDYRTEEVLIKDVPRYFEFERNLGPGYQHVSRVYLADALTKNHANEGVAGFCTVYRSLGRTVLNSARRVKNRPVLELIEA